MTTPRTNDAHEQSGPGPRQQGRLTSKSAPPACDASTTYDTCFIGLSHEQAINQDKYLRQMRLCQIHLDYHLRDMLDQRWRRKLALERGQGHPRRHRLMLDRSRHDDMQMLLVAEALDTAADHREEVLRLITEGHLDPAQTRFDPLLG